MEYKTCSQCNKKFYKKPTCSKCVDCHRKTDTWGRGAIFRKQASANGRLAVA